MNLFDIRLFSLASIIFAALSCVLILLFDIYYEGERHRRLKYKLALYFGSHILTNLCFVMYFYNAPLLIWFNWMFMLNIILVPIFLYAFIFDITTISAREKFSSFHYVAPVLMSIGMLALTLTTPIDEQLNTLNGNGIYVGGSRLFFLFSNKLIFRLIFNLVYVVLSFRRLPRYRQYITSYSANESKASLRWVSLLLVFIVSLNVFPLYGLFVSRSVLSSSVITYLRIVMLIVQYSFLTYHVVKRHYILQEVALPIEDSLLPIENSTIDDNSCLKKNILNKELFESYMHEHKPYLESNLKITDVSQQLSINRTYISTFINTEYGVSFSTYINRLRLVEYNQLRSNAAFANKTNSELSEKAGFGSYRSYTRFAASQNAELISD